MHIFERFSTTFSSKEEVNENTYAIICENLLQVYILNYNVLLFTYIIVLVSVSLHLGEVIEKISNKMLVKKLSKSLSLAILIILEVSLPKIFTFDYDLMEWIWPNFKVIHVQSRFFKLQSLFYALAHHL